VTETTNFKFIKAQILNFRPIARKKFQLRTYFIQESSKSLSKITQHQKSNQIIEKITF
jgi:hypothetical protein